MKRTIAILLAVVLLLATTAIGAPALSFVAVNDTIPMVLSAAERPFYSGGALYIPHTAFAGASPGFYLSYAPGAQYLTLYSGPKRLVFDLVNNTVFDENETHYDISPMGRNGYIFLPAQFCAQYFGVQSSYLMSKDGYPIVRFTNGEQVYDDNYFVDVAQNFIAYQVQQAEKPVVPTVSPSVTPTKPQTQKPEVPPEEPEVPVEPAKVHIALLGGEDLGKNMEKLEDAGYDATVFITPGQAKTMGDELRCYVVRGGTLGILAEQWQDVVTANEALLDQGLPATLFVASKEDLGEQCKTLIIPEILESPQQVAAKHGETALLWLPSNLVESAVNTLVVEEAVTLPLRENTDIK